MDKQPFWVEERSDGWYLVTPHSGYFIGEKEITEWGPYSKELAENQLVNFSHVFFGDCA